MIVTRVSTLPRHAWAAHAPSSGEEVRAVVGPWVEASNSRLFEGAWNGDLGASDFADSYSFMGSGLIDTGERIIAVTPCATLEALYSITDERGFFVSNSVTMLLQVANRDLDKLNIDYEAYALSISGGIHANASPVPLADGAQMRTHYYCNILWDRESGLRESGKPVPKPPANYVEYRQFLTDELQGLARNAMDPARLVTYPPIVFCSTGYDSTACAALGREIGCDEAVVYESKRGNRTDAGTEVVEALGYRTVHHKDELEFMNFDNSHLFLGTGELATSLFFASAGKELTGKLLLSGAHGDMMWGRDNREEPAGQILRSTYPDIAKKEFRLAIGFINVAPAFLTAMIQPEIRRISDSNELKAWRLGTDYDRPIPRRIAEDAGVPREVFGLSKGGGAGSSLRFGNLAYLSHTMPPKSYARFAPYWRRLRRQRVKGFKWFLRSAVYILYVIATWLSLRGVWWPSKALRVGHWSPRFTCSPFAPSGLFVWAVDELRNTSYRDAALAEDTRAS